MKALVPEFFFLFHEVNSTTGDYTIRVTGEYTIPVTSSKLDEALTVIHNEGFVRS